MTDLGGHRHILRGKEGDSLIDLLVKHEEELGGDSEFIILHAPP